MAGLFHEGKKAFSPNQPLQDQFRSAPRGSGFFRARTRLTGALPLYLVIIEHGGYVETLKEEITIVDHLLLKPAKQDNFSETLVIPGLWDGKRNTSGLGSRRHVVALPWLC